MATRVLIAEESGAISTTLSEQLTSFGYDVVGVAQTGADVTRLSNQLKPDIAIVDMELGEGSGDSVAQKLTRQHKIPVIMLTAFSDDDHVHRAEQAGALAYLVKPINPEELPPAIDVALARFRDMQNLRSHIDELNATIESRKVVERAVGILMQRRRVPRDQAQELLEQRAAERGQAIGEIAQAIVDAESLLS